MAAGRATPRLPRDAVERRLFVDAPPAVVWLALHDPARAVATDAILASEPPGLDWPAVGARRRARLRLGPVPFGLRLRFLLGRGFGVGVRRLLGVLLLLELEHRVLGQLFIDDVDQLEVGHGQELDGLLEGRGKDQLLDLPLVQPLLEGHDDPLSRDMAALPQGKSLSQVALAGIFGPDDLRGRALGQDRSPVDDISPVRDLESLPDAMVGDENA